MLNQNEAKARARILKKFLAEHGIQLAHGLTLEAVARMEHHKNWATLIAASNAEAALFVNAQDVSAWPMRVFRLDDDGLQVLPAGVSLSDADRFDAWGLFSDTDATTVPEGFTFGADVAVQRVYSEVPSIGAYGLPDCANDHAAAGWLRETYGVAVVEPLEVSVHDTGADGLVITWVEARLSPQALSRLLPQETAVPVADPEAEAWRRILARVFADDGGQPAARIMEALHKTIRSEVLRGATAEPWLQRNVHEYITLNGPYDVLSCGELFNRLKALAKTEYERLVLSKKA